MGREQIIHSADDMNRLVSDLERYRDRLADIMLGDDRDAAIRAERESDRIEDVYLPKLQTEIARIQALLDADTADEHRRAKARAIKERSKPS
ncbi:MAG TPA: hypothetical protein VGC10_05890 [Sphingomonas sp.]